MNDDRAAFDELAHAIAPGTEQTLVHYLYFTRREDASAVGALLRAKGFRTEDRLGADGVNWLLLGRQRIIPSLEAIAAARQLMEQSALAFAGEYDGWEADLTETT